MVDRSIEIVPPRLNLNYKKGLLIAKIKNHPGHEP
jgi:hypothetical protein